MLPHAAKSQFLNGQSSIQISETAQISYIPQSNLIIAGAWKNNTLWFSVS